MKTASWVIVDKQTGAALFETFQASIIPKINTARYEAVPILTYLQQLNRIVKK
jgi:hypothetical protein